MPASIAIVVISASRETEPDVRATDRSREYILDPFLGMVLAMPNPRWKTTKAECSRQKTNEWYHRAERASYKYSMTEARRLGGPDVLVPEAHPNHSGRNSTQERPLLHHPQRPRNDNWLGTRKYMPNYPILHQHLQPLRSACRKLSAPLDGGQVEVAEAISGELGSQNVGRSHSVLDREIDSHTSN